MKPTTQRSANDANAAADVAPSGVPAKDTVATTASQPAFIRRTVTFLVWAVPAALTMAFGLYDIGKPVMWRDELATWSAASRSLSQLWIMLHHVDAVLGVYYFCMHLWMGGFGDSPTAMRIPSVFAMAGAAALVGLVAKRFTGVVAGLAGGLIYALIPSVSRYAQEARPYAFASFFAALATLLVLRALERPRWHRWAVYALAVAAAGACNLVALCVVMGHATIVLAACLRRSWPKDDAPATVSARGAGRAAGAGAGRAGRATTVVRLVLAELRGAVAAAWRDRLCRRIVISFCGAVAIALVLDSPIIKEGHDQSLYQLGNQAKPSVFDLVGLRGGLWPELFSSSHVGWVVLALAVISVLTMPRRFTSWYALACGVVPIVFVWIFSQGPYSYWTFRYVLFTVPAWALSAGIGVAGIAEFVRRRVPAWRRRGLLQPRYAVTAVLVAAIAALGVHDQWAIRQPEAHNRWAYPLVVPNGEPIDYPFAAQVITAHELPGDGIIYYAGDLNRFEVDASVAYYMRGKPSPRPIFQQKSPAEAGLLQPIDCGAEAPTCLADAGYPRMWVVYVNHLVPDYLDPISAIQSSPDQVPEADALQAAGYQVQNLYEGDGITIALMVRR